jgi:hypothetical protein
VFAGQTPETYLGYVRTEHFSSPEGIAPGQIQTLSYPVRGVRRHHWALSGRWRFHPDKLVAESPGASLRLRFVASKVFLVLGSATGKPVNVRLELQNGDRPAAGFPKTLAIRDHTLYTLVELDAVEDRILELSSDSPGLEAYAFTFGSD